MSVIQVTNISVLNNPCGFLDPFKFEITFEASQLLEEDLEWRLTYVGSADSEAYDQVLDSVLVGPVPVGVNRFVFETPAPDPSKIPPEDLLGVTVVLLECLYKDRVFVRVGYYVSNENPDDPQANKLGNDKDRVEEEGDVMDLEDLKSEDEEEEGEEEGINAEVEADGDAKENIAHSSESATPQPPKKPIVSIPPSKIKRIILDDKPRITRFPIDWDSNPNQAPTTSTTGN